MPDKAGLPHLSDIPETEDINAVDFLDRSLSNNSNVSLLCLGPLTNIAHLVSRKPDILKRTRRIVMMGGCFSVSNNESYDDVQAQGNTPNKVSEWNFYADPHAVKVQTTVHCSLLDSALCNILQECQFTCVDWK